MQTDITKGLSFLRWTIDEFNRFYKKKQVARQTPYGATKENSKIKKHNKKKKLADIHHELRKWQK